MLQELSDETSQMGLKMNIAKTKVMVLDNTQINVEHRDLFKSNIAICLKRKVYIAGVQPAMT